MKRLLVTITLGLAFLSSPLYAATSGRLLVSATVVCNCNVNGIIVPITEGACLPTCDQLKKTQSTGNLIITQNGDTKTIMY